MKFCPKCNQTYTDATLNFCLNDGSPLNVMTTQDAQPTIAMSQARPTSGQVQPNDSYNQPSMQTVWQPAKVPSISPQPTQKKSKAWLWIIGILGLLILFGGVGLVGLLIYIGANIEDNNNGKKNDDDHKLVEKNEKTTDKTDKTEPKGEVLKDNFSTWNYESANLGKSIYKNGQLLVNTAKTGYYFVLTSGKKNFVTNNASTKVTITNINSISTSYGYGLVVHSDPAKPLVNDYAFVIDSEKQRYKIIRHSNRKEINVVDWEDSDAINSGSDENVLEVEDNNDEMKFYINGVYVNSTQDVNGVDNGIVGVYVNETTPIAYSDLVITKNK